MQVDPSLCGVHMSEGMFSNKEEVAQIILPTSSVREVSLFTLSFTTKCTFIFLLLESGITKTCLYNFDILKPHFYTGKLRFTGYTLFFLFLFKNKDCGYVLELPLQGDSNEYPQSLF